MNVIEKINDFFADFFYYPESKEAEEKTDELIAQSREPQLPPDLPELLFDIGIPRGGVGKIRRVRM